MSLKTSYSEIAKKGLQTYTTKKQLVAKSIYQREHCLPLNKYNELKKLLTQGTNDFNSIPYQRAKVYKPKDGTEVYSENRKCQKYTNDDPEVFKFIENNFVPYITINGTKLTLLKNNFDVLNYKKGDRFNKHTDFVKYNSPLFTTYSALFCLKGTENGGETKVWFDGYKYPYIGKCSRNTNGIFVFNSEQFHEGSEIKSGNKIVLKFDLVGFNQDINVDFNGESVTKISRDKIEYKFPLNYYLNTILPLFNKHVKIEYLSSVVINKFLQYLNVTHDNTESLNLINKKLPLDLSLKIIDYLISPTMVTNNNKLGYTLCNLKLSCPNLLPLFVIKKSFGSNDFTRPDDCYFVFLPDGTPLYVTNYYEWNYDSGNMALSYMYQRERKNDDEYYWNKSDGELKLIKLNTKSYKELIEHKKNFFVNLVSNPIGLGYNAIVKMYQDNIADSYEEHGYATVFIQDQKSNIDKKIKSETDFNHIDMKSINNLLDKINIEEIKEFVKGINLEEQFFHSYHRIEETEEEREYCNDGGYYTIPGGIYKSYNQHNYNIFWCAMPI